MGQSSSNLGPRYEMADTVGMRGGFGVVRKFYDNKYKKYTAMKTIDFEIRRNGLPSYVLREISILKELEHENVVRLYNVIYAPMYFRLSFEWVETDLAKLMADGVISAPRIKILRGVRYCHSQKVLHRDLKPHNLLIDRQTDSLKLADFGLSRTFDGAPAEYSHEVGTLAYRAPELILGMQQTTTAADIWSVGCIFAEMVTGSLPFGPTDSAYVMRNIISMLGVPTEIEWPGVTSAIRKLCTTHEIPTTLPKLADIFPSLSSEGVDLISQMLCFLPGKRISAHGALDHPYFSDLL